MNLASDQMRTSQKNKSPSELTVSKYKQGRRKQIKVGWDNFKFCFIAAEKSDKIHILPGKTIYIPKRK